MIVISRRFAKTLLSLVFFLALSAFAFGQTPLGSLTLAWDPSADSSVMGYRLYQGTVSQAYTSVLDTGNQTTSAISGLVPGLTYYFAVTAYDNAGLESTFSGEISYTVPTSAPPMPIVLQAQSTVVPGVGTSMVLSGTGPVGASYTVLATQNFTSWAAIATITLDSSGTFQVTDPPSPFVSCRFYRVVQNPPPGASTAGRTAASTVISRE